MNKHHNILQSFFRRVITVFLGVGVIATARMRENTAVTAEIDYSDGVTVKGELRIMGGRPLIITPLGGHQRRLTSEDVLSIQQRVEKASLEKPWTFKEAGKPEKIYFDGEYPLINFMTRVTLTTGEVIEGHVIAAVYLLTSESGTDKLFLKRQIKGKVGQQIGDVVYAQEMRFISHQPVKGERLSGQVIGGGKLISVKAIDLEREQIHQAEITGNTFDFGRVLPGTFDICVFTDQLVAVGLSNVTPKSFARSAALTPVDKQSLEAVFPKADDFFKDRWIVKVTGNRNYARMLVYKRRADYHAARKITPGGWVWHVDVWNWHNPGTEWKIDSRHIFVRHLQKKDEPVRPLYLVDECGAVSPGKPIILDCGTHREHWQLLRTLN